MTVRGSRGGFVSRAIVLLTRRAFPAARLRTTGAFWFDERTWFPASSENLGGTVTGGNTMKVARKSRSIDARTVLLGIFALLLLANPRQAHANCGDGVLDP